MSVAQKSLPDLNWPRKRRRMSLLLSSAIAIAIMSGAVYLSQQPLSAQEHALPSANSETSDSLIAVAARKPAPDFTLPDMQGRSITLSAYKGKVVLLDFWATWCGGCKTELPWYIEFDKIYSSKGLAVIGISMDDAGPKVVKSFLALKGIAYPVVMGNDALAERFHLQSMPLTLLIDRQGRVAVAHAGVVDQANFEDHIQELLR